MIMIMMMVMMMMTTMTMTLTSSLFSYLVGPENGSVDPSPSVFLREDRNGGDQVIITNYPKHSPSNDAEKC